MRWLLKEEPAIRDQTCQGKTGILGSAEVPAWMRSAKIEPGVMSYYH